MATNLPITGGRELARALRELGPRVERNIMRAALNAGAKVIAQRAQNNAKGVDIAPEARRRLVRAIRWKRARGKPGEVVAGVYLRSVRKPGSDDTADDPRVWGLWVEYGTADRWTGGRTRNGTWRPHRRNRSKTRRFTGRMTAQPYLRPALDSSVNAALEEVREFAARRIPQEAAKAARKAAAK